MKKIMNRLLLTAACSLSALCSAQGLLPPQASTVTVAASDDTYLIGQQVTGSVTVIGETGTRRTLLSYKSAIEVMIVGFFAANCPDQEQRWSQLKRYVQDFTDWRVSFVAVNVGDPATAGALADKMKEMGLHVPLVEEENHSVSQKFRIAAVPTIVVIDEYGFLRYRGAIGKDARDAIETVIGHTGAVTNPEPAEKPGCPLQ